MNELDKIEELSSNSSIDGIPPPSVPECVEEPIDSGKDVSERPTVANCDITEDLSEKGIEETDMPQISVSTQYTQDDYYVLGASLFGRSHLYKEKPCQDYHVFDDLGDGWHIYIVSDGAGSAKESHRGAAANCNLLLRSVQKLLQKTDWKEKGRLPSDLEWHIEFYNLCRGVKGLIESKVESLDEPVETKDFNATLMLLIVSPCGLLVGHIGDGRMGYQDLKGNWQSLITPHKGEEANMTVFLMNKWDKPRIPAMKMAGVYVPETRVVNEIPRKVVVMTDGCENFSWLCLGKDEGTGQYVDRNVPFEGFFQPLFETIGKERPDERLDTFVTFINSSNEISKSEQDDRTMIIGEYGLQRENSQNIIEGQNHPTI